MKSQIYKSERKGKYEVFNDQKYFVRIMGFYRHDYIIFRAVEKISDDFCRPSKKSPEKWQDFKKPDGSFAEVKELKTTFFDIYKEYIIAEIPAN